MTTIRLLAFSDIHNNVKQVERLFQQTTPSEYDLIICCGDMGKLENAKKIGAIAAKTKKPFLYVQGNWDQFPFNSTLSKYSHHLHLNPYYHGEYAFLGYSGCDASTLYEHNTELKKEHSIKPKYAEWQAIREEKLFEAVRKIPSQDKKLILLGHERITHLKLKPIVHVFGHLHQHYWRKYQGVEMVNVAPLSIDSKNKYRIYAIISINDDKVNVTFKTL